MRNDQEPRDDPERTSPDETEAEDTPSPSPVTAARMPRTSVIAGIAILDILLVLTFAATGRASHKEAEGFAGVMLTAWPFLVALLLGWIVARVWRFPTRILPHAVCLWLITVVGGVIVRLLSGRTAEIPFVIVTLIVLGIFLIGDRLLVRLVLKLTQRRATAHTVR